MLTIDYIQDPAHGWIAADIHSLRAYGLADKVSAYSYRDGDIVWLEEDCDAGLYIRALQSAGVPYRIIETHTNGDAFVRRLPRFHA